MRFNLFGNGMVLDSYTVTVAQVTMQRCLVLEIPSLLPPPHLAHLFPEVVELGHRGTGGAGGAAVRAGRGCGRVGPWETEAQEEATKGVDAAGAAPASAECDDNDGVYLKVDPPTKKNPPV
jgi:hypothetical protein